MRWIEELLFQFTKSFRVFERNFYPQFWVGMTTENTLELITPLYMHRRLIMIFVPSASDNQGSLHREN